MIGAIQHIVRTADAAIARVSLALRPERNAVMSFLFHSLFRDEREIALNLVDPLDRTTTTQFRQLIEYYLDHDYRFVSPPDLLTGLDPAGRYALITFDDGYFNNTLALPILEEYRVPAVFFISTDHVLQNKCYWWDVLHRERLAQGASRRRIYAECVAMKRLRTDQIEAELIARFGAEALRPRGDIDRPFSAPELREFARSPYVHLGNHTANHAILTNYTPAEVRAQVRAGQDALEAITGVRPISIAYPNGAHSPEVIEACREVGLKIGFTVRPHKAPLPLNPQSTDLLRLGRFVPNGEVPIAEQCRTYRSDFQFYGRFRSGYLRMLRGQPAQ